MSDMGDEFFLHVMRDFEGLDVWHRGGLYRVVRVSQRGCDVHEGMFELYNRSEDNSICVIVMHEHVLLES